MTNQFPRTADQVSKDPEEQAKLVVAAVFQAVGALKDIADALRDIHAVLETISRKG